MRRLVRYLAFICILLILTMLVFPRYIWPDESGGLGEAVGGDAGGGKLPRDRAIGVNAVMHQSHSNNEGKVHMVLKSIKILSKFPYGYD